MVDTPLGIAGTTDVPGQRPRQRGLEANGFSVGFPIFLPQLGSQTAVKGHPDFIHVSQAHGFDAAVRDATNRAIRGRLNVNLDVVLATWSGATTLNDVRIGSSSTFLLMPMTANAAAEKQLAYFAVPANGSIVLNHSNNGLADRKFRVTVLG